MDKAKVQNIVAEILNIPNSNGREFLPKEPVKEDLLPFLFNRMRTKRLRKKFLSDIRRYAKLLSIDIWTEWLNKRWSHLGKAMAEPIYYKMSQESFMRKLLVCTTDELSSLSDQFKAKREDLELRLNAEK